MNALLHASVSDLWSLAGWTMVHFLWLGAIVAVLATVARIALRSSSPNMRYAVAIGSLFVLAALPLATAAWLLNYSPPLKGGAGGGITGPIAQSPAALPPTPAPTNPLIELNATNTPTAPGSAGGSTLLNNQSTALSTPILPNAQQILSSNAGAAQPRIFRPSTLNPQLSTLVLYLPWLWLIGTPLTFALLVSGVVGTRRLGRSSHAIDSDPIVELLAHLASSLRITRRVTVAVCDRIASPVLIGIVRPMILLPPAAITGWSPDELEMVLLHELAHVRRWDNFVNLLQRCVESLLFFHPAVWLISGWARREREACCDATVVARTNRPHAYAELLVALAAQLPRSVLFHPAASSAMSAGPLRSRIRQILKLEEDPMLVSGKSLTLVLATLLAVATVAVLYLPTIGRAEPSATEATEHTEKSSSATASSEKKEEKNTDHPTNDSTLEPVLTPLSFALKRDASDRIRLFMNGQPVADDVVREVITSQEKFITKMQVSLSAQKGIPYAEVMRVVNLLESLGIKKLALDTRHLEANDETYSGPKNQPHSASGKFPSLEEQKLADLAYKRLGLELEPIDGDDLNRIKALGYDGGVKVTYGAAGLGGQDSMIRPGDVLVGLGIWPTSNMKAVGEILTRPEIAELNPVKFYVVRGETLPAPTGAIPQQRDAVHTGRVEIRNAGSPEEHYSTAAPAPGAAGLAPNSAGDSTYAITTQSLTQAPQSQPPQVRDNTDPYASVQVIEPSGSGKDETITLVSMPLALALHKNEHFLIFFYSPSLPNGLDFPAIREQYKELKKQFPPNSFGAAVVDVTHNQPVAHIYNVLQTPSYAVFWKGDLLYRRSGLQQNDELLRSLQSTPNNTPAANQAATTLQPVDVPTSLAASQNMTPSASLNLLTAAAQRLEEAVQRKSEAMEKRLAAKGDEEIEKSKHGLEAANKQLEEAKRTLEQSKRATSLTVPSDKQPTPTSQPPTEGTASQTQSTNGHIVYAPLDGIIKNVNVEQNQIVHKNDVLLELASPDLEKKIETARASLVKEQAAAHQNEETIRTLQEQLEVLNQKKTMLVVRSPIDGRVATSNVRERLKSRPVNRGEALLEIVGNIIPSGAFTGSTQSSGHYPAPTENVTNAPSAIEPQAGNVPSISTATPVVPANSPYHTVEPLPNERSLVVAPAHALTEAPSDDRILVAYNIPPELVDDVKRARDLPNMHGEFGSGGRYVLQATPERQIRFQQLLDATPKWRDSEKVKSRVKQVYVTTEKDGQEYVKWQPAGLTFTSRTNPKFASPPTGGGGWTTNGVVVTEVAPGSPADWNGIEPGDLMTKAGGFETKSLAELESLLKTQGQDYSTKIVQCFIHRIRAGSIGSFYAQLNLATADLQPKPSGPISDHPGVQAQTTNVHKTSTPSPAASALRYNGKTFDEWREMWKTELSTDKRTESIKALAAFGRNGYGKEAAETILDVAANYDFDSAGMDKNLREAISSALVNAVPVSDWRPLLRSRYDKDPGKWANLAANVLQPASDVDEASSAQNRDFLAQIARLKNQPTASSIAINCLVQRYPDSEETAKLLSEKFKDKNQLPIVVDGYAHTSQYPPAIVDILLHGDQRQQSEVRATIERFTGSAANVKLTANLLQILQDEAKSADHLAAIRALAASGRKSQKPAPETVEALKKAANGRPTDQQIAAGFALEQVTLGGIQAVPFLKGKVHDGNGKTLEPAAIQSLLESEKDAVYGESR